MLRTPLRAAVARYRPLWRVVGMMLILVQLSLPRPATAQAGTMVLTVLLRDVTDRPIAGADVRVVAAATGQVRVEGTTDAAGRVTFHDLVPSAVRVIVVGQMADGTPLRLLGQDAQGIRVSLPSQRWLMDLRVDTDGTVFPDLLSAGAVDGADATAIAQGTFGTPIPTASTATRVPMQPSALLPTPAAAPVSVVTEPTGTSDWLGVILVITLGSLLMAVVLFRRQV